VAEDESGPRLALGERYEDGGRYRRRSRVKQPPTLTNPHEKIGEKQARNGDERGKKPIWGEEKSRSAVLGGGRRAELRYRKASAGESKQTKRPVHSSVLVTAGRPNGNRYLYPFLVTRKQLLNQNKKNFCPARGVGSAPVTQTLKKNICPLETNMRSDESTRYSLHRLVSL